MALVTAEIQDKEVAATFSAENDLELRGGLIANLMTIGN
jgi:hypothetical protein